VNIISSEKTYSCCPSTIFGNQEQNIQEWNYIAYSWTIWWVWLFLCL